MGLNLRQEGRLEIFMDLGTDGTIVFGSIPTMDVDYTIVLNEGLASEVSYGVGTGITLGADSITWAFGTELTATAGTYDGYLESADKTVGPYLKIRLICYVA